MKFSFLFFHIFLMLFLSGCLFSRYSEVETIKYLENLEKKSKNKINFEQQKNVVITSKEKSIDFSKQESISIFSKEIPIDFSKQNNITFQNGKSLKFQEEQSNLFEKSSKYIDINNKDFKKISFDSTKEEDYWKNQKNGNLLLISSKEETEINDLFFQNNKEEYAKKKNEKENLKNTQTILYKIINTAQTLTDVLYIPIKKLIETDFDDRTKEYLNNKN